MVFAGTAAGNKLTTAAAADGWAGVIDGTGSAAAFVLKALALVPLATHRLLVDLAETGGAYSAKRDMVQDSTAALLYTTCGDKRVTRNTRIPR